MSDEFTPENVDALLRDKMNSIASELKSFKEQPGQQAGGQPTVQTPQEPQVNVIVNKPLATTQPVQPQSDIVVPFPEKVVVAPEKVSGTPAPTPVDDDEIPDVSEEVAAVFPAAKNFRKLREKHREAKTKLQETESQIKTLQEQIDSYKTGTAIPDKVVEMQSQIDELRKYKYAVDLKATDEYQQKYIAPMQEARNSIVALAKEYNIPEEVVAKYIENPSAKEVNRFLSEHFDPAAIVTMQQFIGEYRGTKAQAIRAEQDAGETYNTLISDTKASRTVAAERGREKLLSAANDAWIRSALKIKKEGKIAELIPRDNDSRYNKEVVAPIMAYAASEYGKFVKMLADKGLSELTEEMSDFIADKTLRGVTASILADQRDTAVQAYNGLTKNIENSSSYYRPRVGGGGTPSEGAQSEASKYAGMDTKEAARKQFLELYPNYKE